MEAVALPIARPPALPTHPPNINHPNLVPNRTPYARGPARQKARRLEEEVEVAKREMRGLDARSSELEDRDQDLEKMSKEMEPRTKHELSLYAHISNIKWDDYEDTGRVAGVLSKGHSRELKRFDYDNAQLSKFDLVNALWDLME